MAKKIQGIDPHSAKARSEIRKDTRTGYEKFKADLNQWKLALVPFIAAILAFFFTTLSEYLALVSLIALASAKNLKKEPPMFKRKTSGEIDLNNIHPGDHKPMKADGTYFIGNSLRDSGEIWFGKDTITTHQLVFGTTGSGKTEYLIGLCQNALNQSSGFIYVDGKGDSLLYSKIFSLVRRMGREDDLLVVNYMTTGLNKNVKTDRIRTNTINPFSSGSSEELTELITSLLPGSEGSSNGDMWKGRAAIFMDALMRPLVALRDANKLLLDVNTIRQYFNLDILIELLNRDDIQEKHLQGLRAYIENLPGYVKPKTKDQKVKQDSAVYEQHGFITMQYTEVFGMLSDAYSHIMKTQLGEVDFFDVVVNRRILVVLLPALEKSDQSLGNLGKIIVSSVKSMMSFSLGGNLIGNTKDIIEGKPTSAREPYLTIFDEWGYYAVKGASVMPAQARSLNFAMVFAGQDYQAFKKGDEKEAASIVANCKIKLCLALEDASETAQIFEKSAGKAVVEEVTGRKKEKGMFGKYYKDNSDVSYVEKDVIQISDLREQLAGEAHLLFRSQMERVRVFYANPDPANSLNVNTFLKIAPPDFDTRTLYTKNYRDLTKAFIANLKAPEENKEKYKKVFNAAGYTPEISLVMNSIVLKNKLSLNPLTSSILPIALFFERVKFIDDKLVKGIEESFEEHKKEEAEEYSNKSDDEKIKDVEVLNKNVEDVAKRFENPDYRAFNPEKEIQRRLRDKHKTLAKVEEDAREMLKLLNMNTAELSENISDIENSFVNIEIFKGEPPTITPKGCEMLGEAVSLSVTEAVTPTAKTPPERRKKNDYIDNILNEIDKELGDD